ncbi:TetR/AcrR family transcriptional regulator [Bacillus sp. 123MFChir2]|uniref:TetR/AcrR family transcriptional regulator n=1 Tax=Bacillus sp. 123MFChir2 TaxID=1169144 RepID=UPI00036F9639|nr:TetR/AcrR family transcriptional regulator [Bacillus sp. 123MFChir2]
MSTKYEQILERAYILFAENGFEKTSLSIIAKEVRVTKPAIYYYFSSKEELIKELFKVIVKEINFSRFFSMHKYNKENFETQLIHDGILMIQVQEKDVYYSKILNEYVVLSMREEKYENWLQEVLQEYSEGFIGILHFGVELGVLKNENIEAKAQLLTLVVEGLDKYMGSPINLHAEKIWRRSFFLLILGIFLYIIGWNADILHYYAFYMFLSSFYIVVSNRTLLYSFIGILTTAQNAAKKD